MSSRADNNSVTEWSLLLPRVILTALVVINAVSFNSGESARWLWFINSFFVFSILSTYKMRVTVYENYIHIIFGIGLLRIKHKVDKIQSVSHVNPSLLYGIGIRFTPDGILYNINSSPALKVEYSYKGKDKRFMVGVEKREELKGIIYSTFRSLSISS